MYIYIYLLIFMFGICLTSISFGQIISDDFVICPLY